MTATPRPAEPAHAHAPVLRADAAGAIERAADLIRAGRLVAFPTETVYGLGANALDGNAVRGIFAAKGRPAFNPLIVHLADAADLPSVTAGLPPLAARLAEAFWPGALTLVLPRASAVPDIVTAGLDSVGVRVPAHPVARALIAAAGVPIAAPSANLDTRVSPTTAAHVVAQLGTAVGLVLDGGPSGVGIESTVLDVRGERPVLLRPGGVSAADIERVVGAILRPSMQPVGSAPRPSPGMTERHYAPRARLIAFAAADRDRVEGELHAATGLGTRCGLLGFDIALSSTKANLAIELPRDPTGCARELFAALHRIDEEGCELAFVECVPAGDEWEAIADRLRRAGLGRNARGDCVQSQHAGG